MFSRKSLQIKVLVLSSESWVSICSEFSAGGYSIWRNGFCDAVTAVSRAKMEAETMAAMKRWRERSPHHV
jgi:hypothetical protein